jgi:hypothetical protein
VIDFWLEAWGSILVGARTFLITVFKTESETRLAYNSTVTGGYFIGVKGVGT